MTERKRRRQSGGRNRKIASRKGDIKKYQSFIERKIPYHEVLNVDELEIIENNADMLLEEIGIEFRDFPSALELFKKEGADVDG